MSEKYAYKKTPIYTQARFGDIKHSILDNKKCTELLGITPTTSVEKGLSSLIT